MRPDDQALLLKKITSVFLGTHDFRQLARTAADLLLREARNKKVIGAGIFRVHAKENLLYAYAYSTRYRRIIDSILPVKFSELNVPLTLTENLVARAAATDQLQHSRRLADFSRGAVAEDLTDRIQKIVKGRSAVALPIHTRSGRVEGVLMLILTEDKFSADQLALFQTFADQLGLAFSNVFAFERLMQRYEHLAKENFVEKENIPSVKFTLRITPKEDKKLEQAARQQGRTKAEIIRELLDRI